MKLHLLIFAVALLGLTGCQTYRYRIVQPSTGAPAVADQVVIIHYDPLDYRLSRYRNRLAIVITNTTADRIVLQGSRSFVVDPRGESHPIRDGVIGPHSYTTMLVPPVPFGYGYPDYRAYGPGWGWGYIGSWYDPMWGPWYGPGFWGPPPIAYREIRTTYDWQWKDGPARFRFIYERASKTFEHDFEFYREPDKR